MPHPSYYIVGSFSYIVNTIKHFHPKTSQVQHISMASQAHHHLHFLLVPFMCQSHLIPFTDLAKLLASHGSTVTIVLTPLNAARFTKIIDQSKSSSSPNLKIHIKIIPFPSAEAGLPEGCENLDTLPPTPSCQSMFFSATKILKEPLEKWLSELETLPSCIVCDSSLPWTSIVASKFKIPWVKFSGISCFTVLCAHNIGRFKVLESVTSVSEPFLVPDLPDRIEFTKAQLPAIMKDSKAWKNFASEQQTKAAEAEHPAEGVLLNTFQELGEMYFKGYEKIEGKKIWCMGPLFLHDKLIISNKFERDDFESECFDLLVSNKPCSVIYACFGSLCRFSASQMKELALGLEESNRPFIWVMRKTDCSDELEKWLQDEKFVERNKGRGVIVRGWASQVKILSHGSIGGFLTHCGWGSVLEAVSVGVPMITWPMFAEQFFNEKLIVQVLKIGVRIGVEGVSEEEDDEREEGGKVFVEKEDVKIAIDKIMDKGEEAEQRRSRVRELADKARMAVEQGGSSDSNCKSFIQQIAEKVYY